MAAVAPVPMPPAPFVRDSCNSGGADCGLAQAALPAFWIFLEFAPIATRNDPGAHHAQPPQYRRRPVRRHRDRLIELCRKLTGPARGGTSSQRTHTDRATRTCRDHGDTAGAVVALKAFNPQPKETSHEHQH